MKVYAVIEHTYDGYWTESDYDKFFMTRDKAELRKDALERKNKDSSVSFAVSEIEVGE